MEPNDDLKLRGLLKEWTVSNCPPAVEDRISQARKGWWQALLTGYIRVPVPAAVCLAVVLLAGAWFALAPDDTCVANAAPAAELCSPDKKC